MSKKYYYTQAYSILFEIYPESDANTVYKAMHSLTGLLDMICENPKDFPKYIVSAREESERDAMGYFYEITNHNTESE